MGSRKKGEKRVLRRNFVVLWNSRLDAGQLDLWLGEGGGHQSVDGDLGFGLRTVGKPDFPLSVRSLMQDSGRSEGKYDTKGLGQFKKTKKGNMPRREKQSATSNGPFPREFGVIPKLPQKGCRRATQNKAPRLILQFTAGLR